MEGGNEEKLKKKEKGKEEIRNLRVLRTRKRLRTFYFPFFFFLLFTFRKHLKLLRGLLKWKFLLGKKPRITPGKNREK